MDPRCNGFEKDENNDNLKIVLINITSISILKFI